MFKLVLLTLIFMLVSCTTHHRGYVQPQKVPAHVERVIH